MGVLGSIIIFLGLLGCAQLKTSLKTTETFTMKLTSPAFEHNGKIPGKYTCDGKNISPPLNIMDVPAPAKSLVLLMDDPDIPDTAKKNFNIDVWDHWVVFNIPPETKTIAEGKNPPGMPGRNTRGNNTYGGPCPPDREHRYFFKLYALDTQLNLPVGSTKAMVEQSMKGHIMAQATLMGRYERQK